MPKSPSKKNKKIKKNLPLYNSIPLSRSVKTPINYFITYLTTRGISIMTDKRFIDTDLWSRFKAGDRPSFELIYRSHVRALFSFGRQLIDDEDLVSDSIQELFIYIWERRSGLGDTNNIRYYLFKALRRRLIEAVARKNRTAQLHEIVEETHPVEDSMEQILIKDQADAEVKVVLRQALRQLTKRQREAIFLRFFGKMTFQEVADIMSLTLKSTYNLISKALDELRKHFPMLLVSVVAIMV